MSREQLCWRCRKATGGCRWSRFGEPIENWLARKTYITADSVGGVTETYEIRECPEFEKDLPRPCLMEAGARISLKELSGVTGATVRKLRNAEDENVIMLAKRAGLEIEPEKTVKRVWRVKAPAVVYK